MIRHELIASVLRFFDKELQPNELAAHAATCVVAWETPKIIWIQAFSGKLNRKMLRELLDWLRKEGIETVKARRIEGHILPLGEAGPDGVTVISVSKLLKRFSLDN